MTNTDESFHELGQEFQKLASLVPTIPKDQCLSELELIDFVIAYIRQLQQSLSHEPWNECFDKLAMTMKTSLLSSSSSSPSSAAQASTLFDQFMLAPSLALTNAALPVNRRSPLATINLENTRLSWTVSLLMCACLFACLSIFLFVSTQCSIDKRRKDHSFSVDIGAMTILTKKYRQISCAS